MGNLYRNDYSRGWTPSADADNTQGGLLRADNLTLDEQGVVAVRRGVTKAVSGIHLSVPDLPDYYFAPVINQLEPLNSIASVYLGDDKLLLAAGGESVFVDATALDDVTMNGTGDVSFGAGQGEAFFARSSSRYKYNPDDGARNWGIAAPPDAPTLSAVSPPSKVFATFNQSDAEFTAAEGTITATYPTGWNGTANGALELTPAATGRGTITYTFASTTNLLNFSGCIGGDTDMLTLYFWDSQPEKFESLSIMFDVNSGSAGPFEDYYEYRWDDSNEFESTGLSNEETARAINKYFASLPLRRTRPTNDGDKTTAPALRRTPIADIGAVMQGAPERRDLTLSRRLEKSINPGWTAFSVPRLRFKRVGGTANKDWTTGAGIKITYKCTAGATGTVRFDNLTVTSGVDGRILTGNYVVAYQLAHNNGIYTERSPMSPVSQAITLTGQGLGVVIPESTALAMDTQCNEIWLYVWSEQMGAFYRTIYPISLNRPKIRVYEFDDFPDGHIPADDRLSFVTFGIVPGRRFTPGQTSYVYVTGGVSTTTTTQTLETLIPEADGSNLHVGPSGALEMWDCINDATPNGDEDYISLGPPVGQTAYYYCDLSNPAIITTAITDVTMFVSVRAQNVSTGTFKYGLNVNAVDYDADGFKAPASATVYTTYSKSWALNPNSGLAWTLSDVETMSAYVKAEDTSDNSVFCTAVWVVVNGRKSVTTTTPGIIAKSQLDFRIFTSEVELLINDRKLDFSEDMPPDDIIGIAGPYASRWFCLTEEFIWPSLPGNPGNYKAEHGIRVASAQDETALWVEQTTGGIYIGTNKDILRLSGTLEELPDGTLAVQLERLNIGSPPIDKAVCREGNILVYHSGDGWRMFNGTTAVLIRGDVEALYKGYARHGVAPVDHTKGRWRAALGNGLLIYTAPETNLSRIFADEMGPQRNYSMAAMQKRHRLVTVGFPGYEDSTPVLHVHDLEKQRWYRREYPFGIHSLCRDADGPILAAGADGYVYRLDDGNTDDGTAIPYQLWTPYEHDGAPLSRKEAHDIQIGVDTGGSTVTGELWLDDASSAAWSASFSTDGLQHYKADLSDESKFRRAQLQVRGSGSEFRFVDWNLAYRVLPQHRMSVDTGYVQFGENFIVHAREVRLCALTSSNLTVKVYCDGTLTDTKTLTASAGNVTVYRAALGRESHGKQIRILVQTTASAAATEAGFEPFWLELRYRPAGGNTELKTKRWSFENTPAK